MILTTLWERYLFRETLKVFFLFLGCFYSLYALIDYSTHMQDFFVDKRIQISHIFIYYSFQFIKRADMLIPLSMLIATIKVFLTLNAQGELVALQASGIPLKKIARPLLLLATVCTLFNLASGEWILPNCLNYLDRFREEHFKHSFRGNRKEPIHTLYLKDRTKIIYQTQDIDKGVYFDVFWVRSSDDLWRIKTLTLDLEHPVGAYVDHIQRNALGNLEKTESFETYRFAPFKVLPDLAGKGYIPLENRKITDLVRMLGEKRKATALEHPQVMTHLLFKCMIPWMALLAVIAPLPYCVRHTRMTPTFFIYTIALFGFISFYALMDAAVILGENNVIAPWIAILSPFALCSLAFGWKYTKTN
ncbi:MAG: LptF/LptG family permease [Rhabdochlamydiaceae bacterium]|nr:LptF/LptG family permease [Rhabdochlamydiaceae bacterium]